MTGGMNDASVYSCGWGLGWQVRMLARMWQLQNKMGAVGEPATYRSAARLRGGEAGGEGLTGCVDTWQHTNGAGDSSPSGVGGAFERSTVAYRQLCKGGGWLGSSGRW